MRSVRGWFGWVLCFLVLLSRVHAGTDVLVQSDSDGVRFSFPRIARPAVDDLAAKGTWRVIAGRPDRNSGGSVCLSDGRIPRSSDDPRANFFFAAGTGEGLLVLELQQAAEIRQIVSYSWHTGGRAPQVYTLYGATGEEPGFRFPAAVQDLAGLTGWSRLATVDSRSAGIAGGQHAVQVSDAAGSLGRFRHLLFHVLAADPADRFGQTFFSEIDVVSGAADRLQRVELPEVRELTFATQNGEYQFTVDTTAAQELESWTDQQLRPVILEWYPRIVQLLPGPGFQAPRKVRFRYQPDAEMRGIPAYASGNTITLNAEWFRGQLQKEARGCVVHELVHVVQQYSGGGRGPGPGAAAPGWLVEGIPDYIRWFLYEPESGGARLSADRLRTAQHDASYRISANFLDWVIRSQPAESKILEKLNVALRAGRYTPELWQQLTGRTEQQLAESWRQQSEN